MSEALHGRIITPFTRLLLKDGIRQKFSLMAQSVTAQWFQAQIQKNLCKKEGGRSLNKSDFSPSPYTWCIRGQGFHSAEDEDLLLNPEFLEKDAVTDSLRLRCAVSHKDAALEGRELRENVKTYRSEFQKRVIGTLSSSVARNERLFFCKQYLIQYIKRNMDAANWNAYMLLALICDRETLCSLDYQHYLANHDKYSQAHKAQRNSEKSSQFPFALKAGISEDANAYMPVEEYDHLLKVLYDGASQIAQKSGGAKNLFDVLIEFRSFITDVSQDEPASFSSYKAAIDSLLCEITVPDGYTLSLCENDAKKFALFIFSNYISAFQEDKGIDTAAGHFSRGFRVWQYRSFEEDKALYDHAVSLFELSSVWYTQAKNIWPADIARSRFSSDGYCISAEYEESECCEKAKVIQAAAQSYGQG